MLEEIRTPCIVRAVNYKKCNAREKRAYKRRFSKQFHISFVLNHSGGFSVNYGVTYGAVLRFVYNVKRNKEYAVDMRSRWPIGEKSLTRIMRTSVRMYANDSQCG